MIKVADNINLFLPYYCHKSQVLYKYKVVKHYLSPIK